MVPSYFSFFSVAFLSFQQFFFFLRTSYVYVCFSFLPGALIRTSTRYTILRETKTPAAIYMLCFLPVQLCDTLPREFRVNRNNQNSRRGGTLHTAAVPGIYETGRGTAPHLMSFRATMGSSSSQHCSSRKQPSHRNTSEACPYSRVGSTMDVAHSSAVRALSSSSSFSVRV